jgi:hypothetical protein
MLKSLERTRKLGLDIIRKTISIDDVSNDIVDFSDKLGLIDTVGVEEGITYHESVCWVKYHMPVFRPTLELFSALCLTDVSSIVVDDIHFPFDTFFIEVPLDWKFDSKVNGIKKVETLSFHRIKIWQNEVWVFRICFADSMLDFHNKIIFGHSLHDNFNVEIDGEFNNSSFSHDTIINVIIGLAIYITEQGKGKRLDSSIRKHKSKKSRKIAQKAVPNPIVWVLGENIKIGKEIIEAATAAVGNRSLWKVKTRFPVMGHWRNQTCGPKHSERRPKWIEPHFKGPKDGERLTHIYEVEKIDED